MRPSERPQTALGRQIRADIACVKPRDPAARFVREGVLIYPGVHHGAGGVIGKTAIIGNDVTMYHGVTLGDPGWSPGKRHPSVQAGVPIGAGANSVVMEDVAPDMAVVGIPGKLLWTTRKRHRIDNRIDLKYHLMRDQVGDALSALIDRIDSLQARITELQKSARRARITA